MLRWGAESFSAGYCIEEIMFNNFRFLASKMVPDDWKKKAEELAAIGKWDDSHAKLLIKSTEQLQHVTDDIDSEIVSLIRNEWDEHKAIVGKLLPAFLSELFQKEFKSDEFAQMFGLLEKAKEKFLDMYDYENAVKNACCTSWNAKLSNPETMKGENQFNFLVSAFDDGGLGYFDDGLVSATLFMDKKPLCTGIGKQVSFMAWMPGIW